MKLPTRIKCIITGETYQVFNWTKTTNHLIGDFAIENGENMLIFGLFDLTEIEFI